MKSSHNLKYAMLYLVMAISWLFPVSQAYSKTEKILFMGLLQDKQDWQVYIYDDGEIKSLTNNKGGVVNYCYISNPFIAFETSDGNNHTIYFLNLNTGLSSKKATIKGTDQINMIQLSSGGDRIVFSEEAPFGSILSMEGIVLDNTFEILLNNREEKIIPLFWSCFGEAIYYINSEGSLLKKLSIINRKEETVVDLKSFNMKITSASMPCDKEMIVLSVYEEKKGKHKAKIFVYSKNKKIKTIEGNGLIEPYMSKNGEFLYYVDNFGKPMNEIIRYDMKENKADVVNLPKGTFRKPIRIEAY